MMVYSGNTSYIQKNEKIKIKKIILAPGVQKTDFPDFPGFFEENEIKKIAIFLEIAISGNRDFPNRQ